MAVFQYRCLICSVLLKRSCLIDDIKTTDRVVSAYNATTSQGAKVRRTAVAVVDVFATKLCECKCSLKISPEYFFVQTDTKICLRAYLQHGAWFLSTGATTVSIMTFSITTVNIIIINKM